MPYTMPEDGSIDSITIYHGGGSGDVLLAVYSDNSGYPDQRLGVTASTAANSEAGWQTVELTTPVDVNEDETIWLAWVFENNLNVKYTSGTPGRAVSGQGWAGGMPTDFGSSSTASAIYSIYANYTPDQADDGELIGNPYMFAGRRYETEKGLYYYRARYYNPYIGRFLQIDPAYQGSNWYAYCGNNPINYTDPSGMAILTDYLLEWDDFLEVRVGTDVEYSMITALEIWGRPTVIELILHEAAGMWSNAPDACNIITGPLYQLLTGDPCQGHSIPNIDPCGSFIKELESLSDKDFMRRFMKHSHPTWRVYSTMEMLYIIRRLISIKGNAWGEAHPPGEEHGEHYKDKYHFKTKGKKHLVISEKAYEVLKRLGLAK